MPAPALPRFAPFAINHAGGVVHRLDDWGRLDRYLVLGSEGGSYYAAAGRLTRENASAALRCLERDPAQVIARLEAVAQSGRAPSLDPTLFVLALAAAAPHPLARQLALAALPRLIKTGAQLLHFAATADGLRGWGRSLRRAIAGWYERTPVAELAYQVVKYRQRGGWSHRDLLRLTHPRAAPGDAERRALFNWICRGDGGADALPPRLQAAVKLMGQTEVDKACDLIWTWRLPREVVPTPLLREPAVWEALLADMPAQALVRSLGRMAMRGVLEPGSSGAARAAALIGDRDRMKAARVHPVTLLMANLTYGRGRGRISHWRWTTAPEIVAALDAAFADAFAWSPPIGKGLLVALDVSGSMASPMRRGSALTCREAAAALSVVWARSERQVETVAFAAATHPALVATAPSVAGLGVEGLARMPIGAGDSVRDVVTRTDGLPFGATDCGLPILYALDRELAVDAFIVITDSETWAGPVPPIEALARYRAASGLPARLVVLAMTATHFTIADPDDPGCLDVAGFDAATPALVADFLRD